MAKQLVRCINGHVFDIQTAAKCPVCGDAVDSAAAQPPPASVAAPAASTGSVNAKPAAHPVRLFAIGATILIVIVGGWLTIRHLYPPPPSTPSPSHTSAGAAAVKPEPTNQATSAQVSSGAGGNSGANQAAIGVTPQGTAGPAAPAGQNARATIPGIGNASAANPAAQAIGNGDFASGFSYLPAPGRTPNFALAKLWFSRAVQAGSGDGMYGMGLLYDKGWGVKKNYKTAFKWYQKGAAAGSGLAMAGLGNLYGAGKGTTKNLKKYMYWLQKAAQTGFQ